MRLSYAAILMATLYAGCAGAGDPPAAAQAGAAAARPPKPIPDIEPETTEQLRAVLLHIAAGKATMEGYTERAAAAAQGQEMGARLRAYGALQALQLLERKVDGENRVYRYRAVYAQGPVLVDVTFGKGARIDRLQLAPE
ncbi:hypothetical protein [Janthinobacterium fluminis]|uniref:Lipoprotein n=1 Tax=Janthinobacterium fluminis TaxID=2987524 RepID=A0ABT5JWH0_9BURK|nr:hypothetical protein [Janthinobacterium fluminis]MDC8756979.1 hypothetical protein [Janthinobacterium fluminis]